LDVCGCVGPRRHRIPGRTVLIDGKAVTPLRSRYKQEGHPLPAYVVLVGEGTS